MRAAEAQASDCLELLIVFERATQSFESRFGKHMRVVAHIILLLSLIVSIPAKSKTIECDPASSQNSSSGSIVLNVTVTDKSGKAVIDLDKSAFSISDNTVVQQISYFENGDRPLSVGIIFGMPGSKVRLDRRVVSIESIVKSGLLAFIQAGNKNNQYFLQSFHRGGGSFSDWTQDANAIINAIDQAKPHGARALFDVCYSGIEKLVHEGRQKRVLLLISDGWDSDSTRKIEDLRRLIKGSDVLIYCIGIASPDGVGSALEMEGLGFLDEIASVTGGRLYQPKSVNIAPRIFELIALELRHQYSIGYRPSNFADDGKEHRIKLRVQPTPNSAGKTPDLTVRTRLVYLANRKVLVDGS